MLKTVLPNKKGVTLVEVMIALVILLVVFMGLIQASLLTIENTAMNVLRDEAVRLASETVTALRTGSFDDLDHNGNKDYAVDHRPTNHWLFTLSSKGSATEQGNARRLGINTVRGSRNMSSSYVIEVTINPNGALDDNNKQARVVVKWDWKERTFVGGNPYIHQVEVLLRRSS